MSPERVNVKTELFQTWQIHECFCVDTEKKVMFLLIWVNSVYCFQCIHLFVDTSPAVSCFCVLLMVLVASIVSFYGNRNKNLGCAGASGSRPSG